MSDSTSNPSSRLHQLIQEEWEFRLKENPLFATFCADYRYNDRLPSMTLADFERRAEKARSFLKDLQAIDRSSFSSSDQLNASIFEQVLRDQLSEFGFNTHLMPITKVSGLHSSFPDMPDVTPFNTAADYEAYTRRLEGFHEYMQAHITLMRAGMQQGYTPPLCTLQGIEDTLRPHIVQDPSQSMLAKPYQTLPGGIGPAEAGKIRENGLQAILKSVVPGYQSLLDFMTQEYLPAARTGIAASELPDGKAYYAFCVRRFTTLDLTAEQVHQTGLQEVKRIRAEMQALIQRTGFQGDFQAFLRFLRSDPRFYVNTPEALLEKTALILKRMDGELPRLFKKLPRTPYGIRPVPDFSAPFNTTAYYFPLTGDGETAGFYYVNTYDLKSRPLYEMEALSLHEAVPGHHLQLALQQEMKDVPPFRRFGDVTAFIEGWALYAERLGLEVGFYQDPYSDFGRLTYEMWRATRLVVDTGMHALGWSRQQAIDFMAENSALSLLNITNEVDRYISWPGQALAYKTGELKIRELRQYAEKALGSRFDRREFHDVVLENGGIPLDMLDAIVKAWVSKINSGTP